MDTVNNIMRLMGLERKPYIIIEMSMYGHNGDRLSQTGAAVETASSNVAKLMLLALEATGREVLDLAAEVNIKVWHADEDEVSEFAARQQQVADEYKDNPTVEVTTYNTLF